MGAITGLALAGLGIQAAFLDQSFLRKLRAIKRQPTRYLAPLLFTTTLGVFASLSVLILAGSPRTAPTGYVATVGAFTGFFSFWMLGSLLHNLTTLVQYVMLQSDASAVNDDVAPIRRPGTGRAGETRDP